MTRVRFFHWLVEPSPSPGERIVFGRPGKREPADSVRSAAFASSRMPPRSIAPASAPASGSAKSPRRLPTPAAGSVPLPADAAPPWKPEEVVTPARAIELIESQFPALAPAALEPLGVGWDNTAFVVNGSHVFRFPRREVASPLLAAEASLLPVVARHLPLPIPVPTLRGQPSARYRWPFLGYAILPGRTACRFRLDQAQRTRLARPLGQFLSALHAFPVEVAVAQGAGGDTIGRLDLPSRLPRASQMLESTSLKGTLDPGLVQRARALIGASATIQAPARRALVHGDLYARHLLLDDQARLTGIIDWGDIHVGHPAVDLSVAHAFLPPSARLEFLQAYGHPVDPGSWRLARFRALFSALAIVIYGKDTGDAALETEGRQALIHILADDPESDPPTEPVGPDPDAVTERHGPS
jgi:aminoglycoside phosphotransferase (APT) family kinase protein